MSDQRLRILDLLATGSTPKLAAGACGLSESQLKAMRRDDALFDKACTMARNGMLAGAAAKLSRSKDWKAAARLLASAEETRDDYSERQADAGKLEVVFSFTRDGFYGPLPAAPVRGAVIEHRPAEITQHADSSDSLPEPVEDHSAPVETPPPLSRAELEAEQRAELGKRLTAEYVENESSRYDDGAIT